jgi:Na+-driven multidrug efflux pump
MTFGMQCWSLIGAQGKYKVATWVSFVSSWGVTMPMAAIFVYVFFIDLQGLTAATTIGYDILSFDYITCLYFIHSSMLPSIINVDTPHVVQLYRTYCSAQTGKSKLERFRNGMPPPRRAM